MGAVGLKDGFSLTISARPESLASGVSPTSPGSCAYQPYHCSLILFDPGCPLNVVREDPMPEKEESVKEFVTRNLGEEVRRWRLFLLARRGGVGRVEVAR